MTQSSLSPPGPVGFGVQERSPQEQSRPGCSKDAAQHPEGFGGIFLVR